MTTQETAAAELAILTPTQRDVLVLLAKGYDRKEVGAMLGIQTATVRTHNEGICERLACTTIEAAVLASKAGWV